MKKNRMMRLASGLLVAVLATTSVISGTYAKYTTQDGANDVARVAKWGVEVQATGTLYGDEYSNVTGKPVAEVTAPDFISVQSSDASKVLAPGTQSDGGLVFSVTGQPEVTSKVEATIKVQNVFLTKGTYGVIIQVPDGVVTKENFAEDEYYIVSGTGYKAADSWNEGEKYFTLEDKMTYSLDYYYPVVYKLEGSTPYVSGGVLNDSLDKVADAICKRFGTPEEFNIAGATEANNATTTYTISQTYAPNTKLDAADKLDLGEEKLTWAWAFDKDDCVDKVGDSANVYCKADTILGNLAAGANVVKDNGSGVFVVPTAYGDYCTETSFSIDITVTQVD